MVSNQNKVIYFVDLDDSLFQTKRKSELGLFPATKTKDQNKISFFTMKQKSFIDYIFSASDTLVIPLTARTRDQYKRTVFFDDERILYHGLYYGGALYYRGALMQSYSNSIQNSLEITLSKLEDLSFSLKSLLSPAVKIVNVDSFYYFIKNISDHELSLLFEKVSDLSDCIEVYVAEKGVTLLPKIINKCSIVSYLCDQLKPKLVFGLGDSFSDLAFLNRCDFKIISHIGQLNRRLNEEV